LKFGTPGLSHDQLMTNIELYGTRVVSRLRQLVSDQDNPSPQPDDRN
jgi:hypothetical protein